MVTSNSVCKTNCGRSRWGLLVLAGWGAMVCGPIPGAVAQCLNGGVCAAPGCETFVFRGKAVPARIQGPILSVTADGTDAIIVISGSSIRVTPGTPTTTLTNPALTIAELVDPTPFAGRIQPGFEGGVAVIMANGRDILTGELCGADVFVEPGEHNICGPLDFNGLGSDFSGSGVIMGMTIKIVPDPRQPTNVTTNSGLPLDPSTALVGGEATAQGYFGDDGVFYLAIFQAPGQASGVGEQVSVLRTECKNADRIKIQGGATQGNGVVEICDASDPTRCFGVATIKAINPLDPAAGGDWRLGAVLQGVNIDCPTQIRATLFGTGAGSLAETVADVTIR